MCASALCVAKEQVRSSVSTDWAVGMGLGTRLNEA